MFKNMKPLPKAVLAFLATILIVFGGQAVLNSGLVSGMTKKNDSSSQTSQSKSTRSSDSAPVASGNSMKSIVDSGVVRVSVQSPSKPFFSIERGAPQGFNYDFMKMLFAQSEFTGKHARIAIDTDNVVDTYAEVPAALLKSDKVDIAIDGLTFTNDDLPGVVYTIPYVDDFGYALITSGGTMVRSPDDVNDMTIGILEGDPDVKAYVSKQFPRARLKELSDASSAQGRTWINDFIKSGKVDAIIYDYPFAAAEIAGTNLQFAISKLPGSNLKYKIAVRKGDADLLDGLNAAIRKVKADPMYAEMIKTYFMSANLAKVTAAAKTETVYVVKKGDTLSTIAAATLGDRMRYAEIESRNNLPNPNLIQIGQRLVIPKV